MKILSLECIETWEDYMFNEKDLGYYWREFASLLPKEEAANAGRMMNMHASSFP